MRQRSVVSSFILAPSNPSGESKVAIFHRSNDVSTYRNKWAACSGSITSDDPSPRAAALREVNEETGLTSSHFSSIRTGKPFILLDNSLDTEWMIHPFGIVLRPGAPDIKTDWEHTEYRFIPPGDMANFDHVPNLDVGLERVMVGKVTEEILDDLHDDNVSGARQMAIKALMGLGHIVRGEDLRGLKSVDTFWDGVRGAGWHLAKNGRVSMGAAIESAIFQALDSIRSSLEDSEVREGSLESFKEHVSRIIEQTCEQRKHSVEALNENFLVAMEGQDKDQDSAFNITTLSASGTTLSCLKTLAQNERHSKFHLTVLESRPLFEGVTLANDLADCLRSPQRNSVTIQIVTDASIASVISLTTHLIFGADRVSPNGAVMNKVGTLAAAVLAKALNPKCKVLACFDISKITAVGAEDLEIEHGNVDDFVKAWPEAEAQRIRKEGAGALSQVITNPTFEWTDAKWIDAYITDEGILTKDDIARTSKRYEDLEHQIYEDWERLI